MSLLSAAGARRVEAAIGAVEAGSGGELVVAVLPRSGRYALPRAVCAAAWGSALLWAAHHFGPELPCAWLLAAQLPLWGALYALLGVPALTRLLIGRPQASARARARALQMFSERGVHATDAQSGLLLFVSELERQVVVLADVALARRVGPDAWAAQVARVVAGIRARQLDTALVEVVGQCGEILATHFPRRPGAGNQLDDAVVRS